MKDKYSGFTLIELLVVIAIIAILAAILFPVFATAKEKGQQTKCMSGMVQIGRAMSMYSDDNLGYLPYAWNTIDNNWSIWERDTWRERIEKYVKNRKVLICPIPTKYPPPQYTNMVNFIGHYGMNVYVAWNPVNPFAPDTKTAGLRKAGSIPHPMKTILVSENRDGDWSAEPLDNTATGIEGQFYPYHGQGTVKGGVFVFCDSHAEFMSVYKTQQNNFYFWKVIK